MDREQLETRQAELIEELRAETQEQEGEERAEMTDEEIESRKADLEAIKAELEARALKAAEEAEARKAVENGAGEIKEEHKQEDKKMEISEIRNSPEYIEAYANYIRTGNNNECRTVLLSKNAPASGQLPVPDMVESTIKTAWERNEFLNKIRRTYFRGNLRVPFELSATGAWKHVEGTTGLTEEEITIGIVQLVPANIKKLVRVTDECVAMGGEDFIRYIYDEVTYQILKELVKEIVAGIKDASADNSSSAIGIPVVKVAPSVMALPNAATNLSEEATDLCVVMNRLTEAKFNTAYAGASFAIDPFAGFTKVYTSALSAYDSLNENGVYAIVGDLKAIQANYPEGDGIVIKWDDMSEAEDDVVKVVGRQYVGFGVTAPGRLVKLTKPGA
jgi:HK97 family phage major capsid protein